MARDALHNSIQSIINDDKPTVRKSLILGVGGSGMKGILAAKRWIESNMPAEAHRYLRWIGIDTTDIETSIEGKGGMYRFPSDQFFQEERRMLYISAPTPSQLSMDFLRDKFKNDPCFNWLPNPDVYDISTRAGQGANQTRPLGRLAFFFNEDKVRETLLKERDRLDSLSDDPKYFQLMDVKEGRDKTEETITFTMERGVNRYYFSDKIPKDHTVVFFEPDAKARALLCPHIDGKVTMENFPSDERGHYFEMSGANYEGRSFSFQTKHFKRRGQISIFITCSIVGGTGNGMILDIAAMIKDIFKDYWPAPRVYCILVLPSAFKRVVYNRNARANAYAALKEIDYFMSGNTFRAEYPSGRKVEVPDRLFDDGMLYLLDVENMAGNSLQGRDQVQELTGQFISTFVASTVGGAIEERMVNDSTRASIYLPKDEPSQRKAAYNSFGISRVIYPVPLLRELGYKITAMKMIGSFLQPVNKRLLLETVGDINRGLVRALRLNCRLIFERMYPDYKADSDVEFRSYTTKMQRAMEKGDTRGVIATMENLIRDYGKEEMEKTKKNLMLRMEKRYQLELDKMKSTLTTEIHNFIRDPQKGFLFAEAVINLLLGKLELYQKKYYKERVALARHSTEDLEKIVETAEQRKLDDPKLMEAIVEMAGFNFSQLVCEAMLTSAEAFVRDFKALLFNMKNIEVNILKEKVIALLGELKQDVEKDKYELLEKKNPLFFYLINGKEIQEFLETYFYSKLSVEDLCNEVDFVQMDREDDAMQFIETYLISTEGLAVLEKDSDEIRDIIQTRFGHLLEKGLEEIKKELYGEEKTIEDGLNLSETSILKIDIEKIKKKLFKIIYSRFEGFNFENISLKQILDDKKIPVRKLLEKLDTFSRPYIYIEPTGLESMEYYRTVTNFRLSTYEEGDDPSTSTPNDLPARLDHYKKRESAQPNISVETFEVPNLCKPYEIISMGVLLGYPIFKVTSLADSVRDYHALIEERSHPLHCFNHPTLDARYFPDPCRTTNYLNPAKLWSGLVVMKVLEQKEGGYQYEESMAAVLKDIEAREDYKKVILKAEEAIMAGGGYENAPMDIVADAMSSLGMLAKNPSGGGLQFRREYSLVIRDILDGDGTGDRARAQNLTKDQYIEKFVKAPLFANMGELVVFLENEYNVRQFLMTSIKDVIQKTKETTSAGASIILPKWKIDQVELPVFKDKLEFYDYFEKRGSLEWQNVLKTRLVDKLNAYATSSKFRLESDPTLLDRSRVAAFLDSLDQRMPEIVLWEVKIQNKIIK